MAQADLRGIAGEVLRWVVGSGDVWRDGEGSGCVGGVSDLFGMMPG